MSNSDAHKADYKFQRYLRDMDTIPVNGHGPTEKRLGLALFGLGRIGTIHLRQILGLPSLKILYVVDSSEDRMKHLDSEWGLRERGTKLLSPDDAHQIWSDSDVDIVFVCTPTESHESLVSGALRSKKGVLCEKPLAATSEGIRRLYELAAQMDCPLLCAFNRRFDPTYRQIRDRVQDGELGPIVHVIKSTSRDSPMPPINFLKTSGGIFHDCAVHDIDLICWITGEYPVKVTCLASAFVQDIADMSDFDTVAILLKFPSGQLGMIDLSRSTSYGYDQRLEVFGPKGMLSGTGVRPTAVTSDNQMGTTQVPICYSFASRYLEAYREEIEHFSRVVRDWKRTGPTGHKREEVLVTARETLAACRIASACEESAKSGGETVELNWSHGWDLK